MLSEEHQGLPPTLAERQEMMAQSSDVMELEHAIGYSGLPTSLFVLPGTTRYLTVAGGCIVLANIADVHEQTFLRGHDDDITCIRVSQSGRFAVTGQKGHNADACFWDLEELKIVHRFSEHEHAVLRCDITHDDSLVVSVGQEGRMAFFDTSNGGIVTHTPLSAVLPQTDVITDLAFGGKVQDVKRRETNAFHVCVVSTSMVLAYHINPYEGSLVPLKLNLAGFVRKYTRCKYTNYGDLLLVGSESGDIGIINTQSGTLACTVRACSLGVRELTVVGSQLAATMEQTQRLEKGGAQDQQFRYARFGPGSERSTTFFVGGGDGSIVGMSLPDHMQPSAEVLYKRMLDGPVSSLSLAGSSKFAHTLLAGTDRGAVYTVECSSSKEPNEKHVAKVGDSVTFPYGVILPHPTLPEQFVTASEDGVIRLWSMEDYKIIGAFQTHQREESKKFHCTAIAIADGLEMFS